MNQRDLETTVARMASVGACYGPSFSPDGSHIAFLSNLNGNTQAWIVDTRSGWPQLVTADDDRVMSVAWSPNGDWLALDIAPDGGLNRQLYLVRPDGTDLKCVTAGGKVNNWLGQWSHDGSYFVYSSNERSPAAMDGWRYDLASGERTLIHESVGIGRYGDLSRDGRYGLWYQLANRGDNDLLLVDLTSGEQTLLTPHEPPQSYGGQFAADGNSLYLTTNHEQDRTAFGRIQLDDEQQPQAIEILRSRDDAELDSIQLTHEGSRIMLNWNVDGRNELELLDLNTLEPVMQPEMPAEIIAGAVFSPDDELMAFAAFGPQQPLDIWMMDVRSQSMWQVTYSPHAGVNMNRLTAPELVRFQAHDGLEMSGWLYLPENHQQPGPMVFSFHGGPEGQERPLFRADYQALLSQGIAVFAPNVRGSYGFGKRFINLDNGALRVNAVKDIESCAQHMIDAGYADPARLGIMGGSYGGYMTMAGLTEFPDLFAAGANLYGIVNFLTFFEHSEPWMGAISKVEYGDPETEADMLRDLSPIHKIDRVKGATLVMHGANDTNVPLIEAEQTAEALEAQGTPVKLIVFPDEGHGWSKRENRITSTVAIVNWFMEYLGVRDE